MHPLNNVLKAEQEELNQNSEPTKKEDNLLEILESTLVDPTQDIPPPPTCIAILGQDEQDYTFGTLGNISLIIGKAKQRKTFATTCIVASAIHNSSVIDQIKGNLPKDKNKVLYFDTEQSQYHVHKVFKRILKLSESESIPDNILVFALRKFTPKQRRELIETALSHYKNIGLVVIDGIRDLVSSINSEDESTLIASDLLRWSQDLDCHILSILHQNKGNEHARGHIGSELINKAETTATVTTDEDGITKITATHTRDRAFPDIFFTLDEDGTPQYIDKPIKTDHRKQKRSLELTDLNEEIHFKILKSIEASNPKTDTQFIDYLVNEVLLVCREKIGLTKAKQFKSYYSKNDWIKSKGKAKGYEYTYQ
jgi:hypothetical protein